MAPPPPPPRGRTTTTPRRRLRPVIITQGGSRQRSLEAMFAHPPMSVHFDPPLFVPGVPSRSLRPVLGLLRQAERAGLLPPGEHDALRAEAARLVAAAAGGGEPGRHPPYQDLFACLSGGDGGGDGRLPVRAPSGSRERRATGPWAGRHYSVELWCKAKSLGRQRSVLACLLAHLTAMRVLVEGGGDLILEDNVRAPVGGRGGGGWDDDAGGGGGGDGGGHGDEAGWCECAERVWETLRASEGRSEMTGEPCHLRYYGWLGSRENVGWVLGEHAGRFREGGRRDGAGAGAGGGGGGGPLPVVFPFATPKDLGRDRPAPGRREGEEAGGTGVGGGDGNGSAKAGGKGTSPPASPPPPPPSSGVPIWGAYAYWISAEAYGALMDDLRTDVGSILWTSRKMRGYSVKPIDKVLPRKVGELMGRGGGGPGGGGTTAITSPECIHVTSLPAFFRAPMLRSTIHAQWDAEFCVSTEYQLGVAGAGVGMGDLEGGGGRRPWGPLRWEDLWLTEAEVEAVRERRRTGTWRAVAAVPGGGGEGGTGREEDRWEARKRIPRGQLEKLKRLELGG